MPVMPDGPIPAKVMIVGEAPGADEVIRGIPFVGTSGMELNKMLHEAGMSRNECFVTNVCRERPPMNDITKFIAMTKKERTSIHVRLRDKFVLPVIVQGFELLKKEILNVRPEIIIPVGNLSMWALTGRWGITKWRGSMLNTDIEIPGRPAVTPGSAYTPWKVVPTYHPAAILRQWDWRATMVYDLRRAASFRNGRAYPVPLLKFIIQPSYEVAVCTLEALILRLDADEVLRLSFDIETRKGHIACAGLSWSRVEAICIPFMCLGKLDGYWNSEQEANLIFLFYKILTHINARVIGQNIIYDSQYTYRHWHFVPNVSQDTMISQHSIFSALPKGLDYLASMYCKYYVYWKGEGKDFYENV